VPDKQGEMTRDEVATQLAPLTLAASLSSDRDVLLVGTILTTLLRCLEDADRERLESLARRAAMLADAPWEM
jgi:hypothetical protein